MNLMVEHAEFGIVQFSSRVLHQKSIAFLIIVHVLEGAYQIDIGPRDWRVAKGETFIVPPDMKVRFDHLPGPAGGMRAAWAHLAVTVGEAHDWSDVFHLPAHLTGGASRQIGRSLLHIQGILPCLNLAGQAAYQSGILNMLAILGRVLQEKPRNQNNPDADRIQLLRAYMRRHLARPLAVDELAGTLHLSKSHFHELVKRITGSTPRRMLLGIRVQAAKRLIVRPGIKIEQAARECGFTCPFHFSKAFKSVAGVSPSTYRKQAASALDCYRGITPGKIHPGHRFLHATD